MRPVSSAVTIGTNGCRPGSTKKPPTGRGSRPSVFTSSQANYDASSRSCAPPGRTPWTGHRALRHPAGGRGPSPAPPARGTARAHHPAARAPRTRRARRHLDGTVRQSTARPAGRRPRDVASRGWAASGTACTSARRRPARGWRSTPCTSSASARTSIPAALATTSSSRTGSARQLDGALPTLARPDRRAGAGPDAAFSTAPVVVARSRVATCARPGSDSRADGSCPPCATWPATPPCPRRSGRGDVRQGSERCRVVRRRAADDRPPRHGAGVAGARSAGRDAHRRRRRDAGAVLARAREREFTRFDGNLAGPTGCPTSGVGEQAISPTALEKYAGCPHAFFVERLLGVRPIENPEDIVTIPANELGTFIHECMDELTKQGRPAGCLASRGPPSTAVRCSRSPSRRRPTYEHRGITGHQRLWAVEKERVSDHARRDARRGQRLAGRERCCGQGSRARVRNERKPSDQGRRAGRGDLMRGSADKVDVADGRIYVTDIKSGRRSGFTSIKQDDPAPYGSKLQLPAYAFAALSDPRPDLPVTAGVLVRPQGQRPRRPRVRRRGEGALRTGARRPRRGIAGGLYPAAHRRTTTSPSSSVRSATPTASDTPAADGRGPPSPGSPSSRPSSRSSSTTR